MKEERTYLILGQKPENNWCIQGILEQSAYPFSGNVADGIKMFQILLVDQTPELVIIDATVCSTSEALSAFKLTKSRTPGTPVIFVINNGMTSAVFELMQGGATDFVLSNNLHQLSLKVQEIFQYNSDLGLKQTSSGHPENMHKKITDLSLDIICSIDQDGRLITVSAASKLILDYLPEELIGKNVVDLVCEGDKEKTLLAIQNLKFGIDIINFEISCLRKNGALVTLLWSARWDTDDELGYGVAKDITDIKKAEEELRRKEQRFRGILQNSSDGLVLIDAEGTIIELTSSAKKLLKLPEYTSNGSFLFDFAHPEDNATLRDIWEQVRTQVGALHSLEFRFSLTGSPYKWLEATFHNQLDEPSIAAIVINIRDITKRKETEIALRAREASLKEAQELGHIGNWEVDLVTGTTTWSEEMYCILGLTPEGHVPSFESFVSFIHPEDKPHMLEQLQKDWDALTGNRHHHRIMRPNGEVRYVIIDARYEFDNTGKPIRLFGIIQDLTDRKVIETALEQSKEKYRLLFNLSPIPMWVYEIETLQFVDVNEAAIRHYGYSRQEFLSMKLTDIRPKEDLHNFVQQIRERNREGGYRAASARHLKKSGEIMHVQIHGDAIDIFDRQTRVIVATDVTDRVRYIKAIEAQNAKLREIAWLQSHKVRAPLARIMALIDVLSIPDNDELSQADLLNYVQRSAYELDSIIKEIVQKAEQVRQQTYMEEED